LFSAETLLLTGASGGIGNCILEDFIDKVKFMITSNRSILNNFLKIDPKPDNLKHLTLDLTSEENVESLFNQIYENFSSLDILINCIGGSLYSHPIEDFPVEEFDEVLSVNLRSAFLLTKEAIKLMKNNKNGGNIIHFVSSSAKNISHNKAPYGTAKAGLAHLIHYAASEAAKYNIKINGISPTYVFTPRHKKEIEEKSRKDNIKKDKIIKDILKNQLMKKPLYPKDLLETVRLLATTDSITGQIYNITMGEVLE
jgi:3-hydroxybutyrate dehydrogenase